MPSPANDSRDYSLPPRFENLEERLLLTTLIEGQTFIYQNAAGNSVRIGLIDDLTNGVTATCELFTTIWDNGTLYLSDLPGFYSTGNSPYGDYLAGNHVTFSPSGTPALFVDTDATPPTITWQPYDEEAGIRPATVEIYAIYFSVATSKTILTISALQSSSLTNATFDKGNLSVWNSDAPGIYLDTPDIITAPDGSGGVIVGAIAVDIPLQVGVRYDAVDSDAVNDSIVMDPSYFGVFPGGDLRPGITISGSGFFDFNNVGSGNLGDSSASLASDSAGGINSVDSSEFKAWLVGPGLSAASSGQTQYSLGGNVKGLASDGSGLLYSANNGVENVDFFTDASSDSQALASNGFGYYYFVRSSDNYLIRTTRGGVRNNIGRIELNQSTFFENITAMDYLSNPTGDILYAVGTKNPDASGNQYLIQIDPTSGKVSNPKRLDKDLGTGIGVISSIAFDSDGILYGLDATANQLVTIDLLNGEVTYLATVIEDPGGSDLVIRGITGIDFIGGTLYGVTSGSPFIPKVPAIPPTPEIPEVPAVDAMLYTIDTATAEAFAVGPMDIYDASALAFDASYPGALFTLASDKEFNNGITNQIGRIALGSAIVTSSRNGSTNWLSHLYDSVDSTIVYTDVDSLAFDSNGDLWGMAKKVNVGAGTYDPSDTTEYLIRINKGDLLAGKVSLALTPSIAGTYDGLAFDGSDTLYAIDGGKLSTINTTTGVVTAIVGDSGLSFVGIVFEYGALYGVTAGQTTPFVVTSKLYEINPADGADVAQIADLGRTDITALTVDPTTQGMLWTTGKDLAGYYRAASLPLSATLKSVDNGGSATDVGLIFDDTLDGIAYKDFHALDYNSSDELFGIATVNDVRRYDGIVPPAPGAYLLKIDPATGEATRVVLIDQSDLVSIAFDKDDVLYGILPDGGTNKLVTLDTSTGVTAEIAAFSTTIDAIEFAGELDILYGVESGLYDPVTPVWAKLYSIDPATAICTYLWELTDPTSTFGITEVTGIAENPSDPDQLLFTNYGTFLSPEGSKVVYYLASGVIDTSLQYQDFGKFAIAGTLAGSLYTAGSVETIRLGFLYGNVYIGHNLGDLITEKGAGAVKLEDWSTADSDFREVVFPRNPDTGISSMVFVSGTARMIDFRGDPDSMETEFSWTGVEVTSDPNVSLPSRTINEVEYGVEGMDEAQIEGEWISGESAYYTNDRKEFAQYVTHPSGEFWIIGDISNEADSDNPDGSQQKQDWYALPLMAGQTIEVDLMERVPDPNNPGKYIYVVPSIPWSSNQIRLYDFDGNWVDSWGYETEEDEGSRSLGFNFEPMVFTAPAAGIYYLVVMNYGLNSSTDGTAYRVHVQNGPSQALGGLNVVGSYDPEYPGNVGSDTYQNATSANVSVKHGGGIGAVSVWDELIGSTIRSFGLGDLVSVYGGTIGGREEGGINSIPTSILSDSNIGMVSAFDDTDVTTEGWLDAYITAGGTYNYNAHIQNVFAAADGLPRFISATGSIGTIETIGSLYGGGVIQVDSDYGVGWAKAGEPGGNIDLIRVHNNFGGFLLRDGNDPTDSIYDPVRIYTNPGGDVRFLSVDGDIYSFSDVGFWLIQPSTSRNGETLHFFDDSGGEIWITPVEQFITDPLTGLWTTWFPSIDVYQFGVNDYVQGGVGGAIARIRSDGPITVITDGVVQVGNWDVSWGWNEVDPANPSPDRPLDTSISFTGSGDLHIYYLHDDGVEDYNFDSIIISDSSDDGDVHLVSGYLRTTRLESMKIGGDLGAIDHVSTGSWIFGHDDAPPESGVDVLDEVVYGWYHNKIQGLRVDAGDLVESVPNPFTGITGSYFRRAVGTLEVGGSLRDLRVQGTIGSVVVSADGLTNFSTWDGWEGVEGVIWSDTRIEYIKVGDGLADDGSAWAPEAGIFSGGSIGSVIINRTYYEITPPIDADLNTLLQNRFYYNGAINYKRRYGMLDGSIIALNNSLIYEEDDFGQIITSIDPTDGSIILNQIEAHGISLIKGTNGAKTSAIMAVATLNNWRAYEHLSRGISSGGIGTIEFSGVGGEINAAYVMAGYLNRMATSVNSAGINFSHVEIQTFRDDRQYGINTISAGGPGMYYSTISVTGSRGGTMEIKGNGGQADFVGNHFLSSTNIGTIKSRDMVGNRFEVTGKINNLYATRDFRDHVNGYGYHVLWYLSGLAGLNAGAVGSFTVGRNVDNNDINIAGELTSMRVHGAFLDTQLDMYGPTTSYLKSLIVTGDIGGQINVQGDIGSIISLNGAIYAEINTIPHSIDSDVGLIEAANGIFGPLDIAGSVNSIISHTSLGQNPALFGQTQLFNIWGDLNSLRVIGSDSHLFADINVGGDIGTVDIGGTMYSNIRTNGNFNKLIVDGALGGDLRGAVGNRGSLTVFGNLNSLKFDTSSDLVATLDLGGSIGKIALRNSNLIGDITSRYGTIYKITVTGGRIEGDLTAKQIGSIQVTGGSISGSIEATGGGIKRVVVRNGNLDADVTASNGKIDLIQVTNGNVTGDIYGASGIKKLIVSGGNLEGNVTSDGTIDLLQVRRGSLTGLVSAGGEIKNVRVDGDVTGQVRSGSKIGKFQAGSLSDGSIISSAWDITLIKIKGDVTDSKILAGYDIGSDGAIGGGDDNLNNYVVNDYVVHSGSIKKLAIGGIMSGSVVAAGVDPGPDNSYLLTTDNTVADGISSIYKMTVRGGFADVANSAILADTMIDSKLKASALAAGVTKVSADEYDRPEPSNSGGEFGQGTANGATKVFGNLTITLKGPGTAKYEVGTGNLALYGTTSRTSLTFKNTGASVTINIDSADDSGLSSLKTSGVVKLGNVDIDGEVRTLNVFAVANDSTWALPGGVKTAKVGGNLTNVDITAGYLNNWRFMGSYLSGDFKAAGVKSLRVNGSLGGNFNSYMGEARSLSVKGNLTGNVTANGAIRKLNVSGSLSGSVTVETGDLLTLNVGGNLSGAVDVQRGMTRTVNIRTGNFGGTNDTSFRTTDGITNFKVKRGNFSGLLSTGGDLKNLQAQNGSFTGRVWSGGSIRNVKFYNMNGGMLSASGDIQTVNIKYDMAGSWIFAGFNPGDAGYDADNPDESDNLKIDAFTATVEAVDDPITDQAGGGTIKRVTIGGDMGRLYNAAWGSYTYAGSTISAGIAPGTDGYVGTSDDRVEGTGYIGKVRVRGGIYGSGSGSESYGVYAASNTPVVYHHSRQLFYSNYNSSVGTMYASAGNLTVTDVYKSDTYIWVTFSHALNAETIDENSFILIASVDDDFTTLGDNTNVSVDVANDIYYSTSSYMFSVILELSANQTWATINKGLNLQLTIDSSVVSDNRGNMLDGEFIGAFASGDGEEGGDFIWSTVGHDMADSFAEALDQDALTPSLDDVPLIVGDIFESSSDIDIYKFSASAYDYLATQYIGSSEAEMGLFFRDTQGTASTGDDTFELVAAPEDAIKEYEDIFQAFELAETGEYYLVVVSRRVVGSGSYSVILTLSSSDQKLVDHLGGALPSGEQIAYVSNEIGDNNNTLGAQTPKQLVYLNFDGGTTTKYQERTGREYTITPFDMSEVELSVAGTEELMINGGTAGDGETVTGIVDNMVSIFQNTPASFQSTGHSADSITVLSLDISSDADWATFTAADEGLFFTTIDPTVRGLDVNEDFTTIFLGGVTGVGSFLLGRAAGIDFANMEKADQAFVSTNNFGYLASYFTTMTESEKLDAYSFAFANTTAHELGHVLGLRHQPTDYVNFYLISDDPDNNPGTADDSNTGGGLMAYGSTVADYSGLYELGTALFEPSEFPIGHIDTAESLIDWLS